MASLELHARQHHHYISTLTDKEQDLIRETANLLRDLHVEGENHISQAQKQLEEYSKAREVEAAQLAQERLEEEKARAEQLEQQKEQERKESIERAKVQQAKEEEDRVERCKQEKQREEEDRQRQEQEKQDRLDKEKEAKSKEHLAAYAKRLKLLDVMKSTITSVVDSTDPETKKIRLQVKKNVRSQMRCFVSSEITPC